VRDLCHSYVKYEQPFIQQLFIGNEIVNRKKKQTKSTYSESSTRKNCIESSVLHAASIVIKKAWSTNKKLQ